MLPLYLEYDNLGKKKIWNLRNFEKKLEKPGILNKKFEMFKIFSSKTSI